ncbi:MAG: MBL fold metallo-hydrolase [Myxococcales bacterium]|nr:MBL fold metallo-hydrolase [Myxococcales bacterium]
MRLTSAIALALLVLAGCPAPRAAPPATPSPRPDAPPAPPDAPDAPSAPAIAWTRVETAADLPGAPPAAGTWRIHLIDVGTGLAILVEGADFTLLYDAGTNDPDEKPARVLAYLGAALGPSGPAPGGAAAAADPTCAATGAAAGARRRVDHVVLSHPHLDHASALDEVVRCYQVGTLWDAGRINHAVFYRDLLLTVAATTGTHYRTAAPPPADRTLTVKGVAVTIPPAVPWQSFSEGDEVALGAGARMTILHAEPKGHADPNGNSIVIAVDLGAARLLLTGDAESGPRADPSAPLGDVEQHLVERFAPQLDADILQVGHHGSKTSSRRAFLAAVTPSLALVSAGPRSYKGTRLPDPEVLAALEDAGATVLRTDLRDGACPLVERLGPGKGPGGCDSWLITVGAGAP